MSTLPESISGVLDFARAHRPIWETHKDTLNLPQTAIDELASTLAIAEQDRAASVSAKDAALAATATQNASLADLVKQLRGMLKTINATAANAADPGAIYRTAQIPAPKTPTELEAPPAPVNVIADYIAADGTVSLKWAIPEKDAFIGKTVFKVFRALEQPITGSGLSSVPFTYLGLAHDRDYIDDAVPNGYGQALYQVVATRNGFDSPASMAAIVKFGNVAGSIVGNSDSGEGESTLAEAA